MNFGVKALVVAVAVCGLIAGGVTSPAFAGGDAHVKETIKHAKEGIEHQKETDQACWKKH